MSLFLKLTYGEIIMKKNLSSLEEQITIDKATGEITSKKTIKKFKVDTEPNYIRLYLSDISLLNKITKTENKVLLELIKITKYLNEIDITLTIKKRIAKNLNSTVGMVTKSLSLLNKAEIVIRVDSGCYLLNPFIFGKGDWGQLKIIRSDYLDEKYN